MSLIPRKMLDESIDLSHTVDTEERYIWRNSEQTIEGKKTFTSPSLGGDRLLKQADAAVPVKWIMSFLEHGGWATQEILITEQDIANGYVEFDVGGFRYNKDSFHVELDGAGALILGTDYSLSDGEKLSFCDALKVKLMANDKLKITYERQEGAA